jgi:hypothetical protein
MVNLTTREIMVLKEIKAITAHKVLTDSSHITKAATVVEATDLATAVLKAGAAEARALMVNNPVIKAGVHLNKVCKDSKTGTDLRKTRNGEAALRVLMVPAVETKVLLMAAIMAKAILPAVVETVLPIA